MKTIKKHQKLNILLLSALFFATACQVNKLAMKKTKNFQPLPDYIDINNQNQSEQLRSVLTTASQNITFPLSLEDKNIIKILEQKFDQEENCAGLAAPQIGFHKKIIIFAAPKNPELIKWRPDFTQFLDKQIWLNPSYNPINQETHEDYEGCFSVQDRAGLVKRFKKISYQAYTPTGELIKGEAEGFLARIIQHEIDHINGILFISKADPHSIKKLSEYRQMRAKAQKEGH